MSLIYVNASTINGVESTLKGGGGFIPGPAFTSGLTPWAAEKHNCRTFEIVPTTTALCIAQSQIASPVLKCNQNPVAIRRLPLETRWRDKTLDIPDEDVSSSPDLRPFNPTIITCDKYHGAARLLIVRKSRAHIAALIDYTKGKVVSRCNDN